MPPRTGPGAELRRIAYRLMYPLNKVRWTFEAFAWRGEYRDELEIARTTARPGPLDVILVLDHLKPRANAGKLVRTADAMGAKEIRTIGMPYFNTRPSVESIRNIPLHADATVAECFEVLRGRGYALLALEPDRDVAKRSYLDETALPTKCALIVGHESHGVSFRADEHPDVRWLSIRQFGRVPCLNASVAGSIALYEYARQHGPR